MSNEAEGEMVQDGMVDPRFDHVFDASEQIVDEAASHLVHGGRVRIYFPGGPLDPIRIHGRGEWTELVIGEGENVTLQTRSIVGWQLLD